jgi:aspartyl-tRNA(Asn)/glutamyl-tRNA(Gln) amidotransferase subunit C
MKIDEKTILYLEDLSFLTLSNDERKRIAGDLETILGYMEALSTLNTSGVPNQRSDVMENVLRADEIKESVLHAEILKNAPKSDESFFIVPKTLE